MIAVAVRCIFLRVRAASRTRAHKTHPERSEFIPTVSVANLLILSIFSLVAHHAGKAQRPFRFGSQSLNLKGYMNKDPIFWSFLIA